MTTQAPGLPEPFRAGVAAALDTREAVRASGEDAVDFLQGQLSQDVKKLGEGESAWSLLLQPQGKVDSYLRVTRLGEAEFILDIDAGFADAMVTRLNRFKLRTKCDLEPLGWQSASVRGVDAGTVQVAGATVAAAVTTPGFDGTDFLGPSLTLPDDLVVVDRETFEVARIAAAVPAMGHELTENTIPAAAGVVDGAVSFDKGCYTGQELVARIDSRGGNVPHRLVALRFGDALDGGALPESGAALRASGAADDAKDIGWLTSIASEADRSPVGLGYLARSVETPAEIEVVWAQGPTSVDAVSAL